MKRTQDMVIPLAVVAFFFFVSGLTGLVYEIVWLRRLQLTFGSTTYSITTVLAAFMAGLGFGSYIIGRRVDRSRLGGLRIYGLLELGIGLYALISLPLLWLTESLYVALQTRMALGQGGAALLKMMLSFPVLAIPAGLMGGTLPALVSGLLRQHASLHATVGRLYGFNTAGAAVGVALAGMVLIEQIGLWRSVLLAALLNLAVGAAVLFWTRGPGAADASPAGADDVRLRDHLRAPAVAFCAAAVVLTGALSMLYEVVWARLLSLVVGSSAYSFTIVLTIFLVGIALGALAYARLSRDRPPSAFGLALVLFGLALWVALTVAAMPTMPRALMWLNQMPGVTFARAMIFQVMLAGLVLLVPTLLLGAALPMAMGVISRTLGRVGADVGGVYLANTLGAIAGSVLTGFVFIPLWGTQSTLLVGLWANLALVAAGMVLFSGSRLRRGLGTVAVVLVAAYAISLPAWPPALFDAGVAFQHGMTPAESVLQVEQRLARKPTRLLFFEEGVNATISVRQSSSWLSLMVNGKADASTSNDDMATQVILGVAATMAHPKPRDVAVIGWGSGVTAHSVSLFSEVQRVDAIEIERAVVNATTFFRDFNGNAARDPKVRLIYDDARSYFQTTDRQYDVIISEPSNPWMVGSALFTKDFYALVKRKLRSGGVFGQWLQLYRLDSDAVALIMRTMLASFPHVELWYSQSSDVVLIGSAKPIRHSLERVREAYAADPRLPFLMSAHGPGPRPGNLYGCFLLDRKALERVVKPFHEEVLSDDQPVLEYRAMRSLYRRTHDHFDALWSAKLSLGVLLPTMIGKKPSPAAALAGASRLLANTRALRSKITRRAVKGSPQHPEARLQRAKFLYRLDRLARARTLIKPLLAGGAFRGEASLLEARIFMDERAPEKALAALDRVPDHRPIARTWFKVRAAAAAGKYDLAWTLIDTLQKQVARARLDPDTRRLSWANVYSTVHKLGARTGQRRRASEFLKSQRRYHDDMFRLHYLVETYERRKLHRHAAYYLDRLMAYGDLDADILRRCERIYKKVKQVDKSERCRQRRLRLLEVPRGKRLWPGE